MNVPESGTYNALSGVTAEPDGLRLAVLRLLEQNPSMSQRDLSQSLGLSLGKTHYLLHALLDKGWVKARNFRRSDNKWAYAYLLTPSGVRHKLALTHSFLAAKEREFESLQQTIGQLRRELGVSVVVASRDKSAGKAQP